MSVAQSKQIRDRVLTRFLTNSRQHFFAGLATDDLSGDCRRPNTPTTCTSGTTPRPGKSDD